MKAGVKHQTGFNFRFVPAVRLAWDLIRAGKLGKLYLFRASYLQEWIMPHYETPMVWRTDKKRCGSRDGGEDSERPPTIRPYDRVLHET